ncbi:MAG TPA: hypothetical protein VGF68_14135, partial [Solirubrobacteraceae bacterium]
VTVSSAKGLSKAAGVKGKLGVFKRNGIMQLTLGGHPLYTFSQDHQKSHATGEALATFGGTWHVVKDPSAGGSTGNTGNTTSTSTSTTPTSPYPGY